MKRNSIKMGREENGTWRSPGRPIQRCRCSPRCAPSPGVHLLSAVLTKFVIVQYQVLLANLPLSYYPPKPSYVVFQAWSKTNSWSKSSMGYEDRTKTKIFKILVTTFDLFYDNDKIILTQINQLLFPKFGGDEQNYCWLVLNFVKKLFWYRRMFVILLSHGTL